MWRLLAMLALVLVPRDLAAQDFDSQAALCETGAPDASVGACTWLLRSGELAQESYAHAYFNRANSYAALKRFQLALSDYDEAIRLDPDYAPAFTNKGNTLGTMGRLEEAIEMFDASIELDAAGAKVFYNRGRAFYGLKRYRAAIRDFDVAIHLEPRYATAFHVRGKAYFRMERFDRAVADFEETIRLAPGSPEAHDMLAWLLATEPSVRAPDRAVAVAQMALGLEESASRWDTLGAAYVAADRREDAVEAYTTALGLDEAYREKVADWLAGNGYPSGANAGDDGRPLLAAMEACVRAGCVLGVGR